MRSTSENNVVKTQDLHNLKSGATEYAQCNFGVDKKIDKNFEANFKIWNFF